MRGHLRRVPHEGSSVARDGPMRGARGRAEGRPEARPAQGGRRQQTAGPRAGLRPARHPAWGAPAYLAGFARKIRALHSPVGGKLVLIGVSYPGFGLATLASPHPELRPDRLIVIDSYPDLVARRESLPPTHPT